jgi:hypothetical protein
MIITNFNIERVAGCPAKANAPLFVDSNRMLSGTISVQRFEPIARGNAQVCQPDRPIQQRQFVQRALLDGGWKSARTFRLPD